MTHWHRAAEEPSILADPPKCCRDEFDKELNGELDRAIERSEADVRAERHRIVAQVTASLEAYAESVATVLTEDAHIELVGKVVGYAITSIRQVGCICRPVAIMTMGRAKPLRSVPSLDPLCGVHEVAS